MIPIHWTEKTPIKDLPELLDNYRKYGGKIVMYQRVWSAVFFSQKTSHVVWVPKGKSPIKEGLKYTLFSFFLGWWSITGFFWTLGVLFKNLSGGSDLTLELTQPPPLSDQPKPESPKTNWPVVIILGICLSLLGALAFFKYWMHR